MNLLLILNEAAAGDHEDVHWALSKLTERGVLEDYRVYPFLSRLVAGLSSKDVCQEIFLLARETSPTAILWAHTPGLSIERGFTDSLRSLKSSPSLGYWDADVYQSPYKPLPLEIRELASSCDVSFWPAYSKMIEQLRKAGCRDMRYVPLPTDPVRFGASRTVEPEFDVVMVCNYISSRIPWRTFPGSRWRKRIARYFHERLGSRFAVFGEGWNEAYAHGPIPFRDQGKIYQKSRLALGVNNLHGSYYFSNRLPISMSSGVIMVHNYESGFEELFQGVDYQFFFKDNLGAWEITQRLLNAPLNRLSELESTARSFASNSLSILNCFEFMVGTLRDHYGAMRDGKQVHVSANPWLSRKQL